MDSKKENKKIRISVLTKIFINKTAKYSVTFWGWIYKKTMPTPKAPNKENCIIKCEIRDCLKCDKKYDR